MADIFISYAKADRLVVEDLAATLQAEGWSVWFDRALAAGDAYRDEIMQELVAARAVVVLWTENSIGSDWVRAEAGRAKASGKLIPVKSDGVDYGAIPLPFGEMHTEPLRNKPLIRAAITAQLATPAVAQGQTVNLANNIKAAAFTWVGILGGALTLLTNMKSIIDFAHWTEAILRFWSDWVHLIWHELFQKLFHFNIAKEWSIALTYLLFSLSTIVGARLALRSQRDLAQPDTYAKSALDVRTPLTAGLLTILGAFVLIVSASAANFEPFHLRRVVGYVTSRPYSNWVPEFVGSVALISILLARDRLFASLYVFGFLLVVPGAFIDRISAATVFAGPDALRTNRLSLLFVVSMIAAFIPLSLALLPARVLFRRLVVLVLVMATVIGLNWTEKKLVGPGIGQPSITPPAVGGAR